MNKQVEQIKAEIERLKKWCEEHTTESYSCYFDAFNDIDTFINSLEEEPVSKFDSCIQEEIPYTKEEIKGMVKTIQQLRKKNEELREIVLTFIYSAKPLPQVIEDVRKRLFNID